MICLILVVHACIQQCCALLSEAMESDPDRDATSAAAKTHGMAPSLPLNNDDIKGRGDHANAHADDQDATNSASASASSEESSAEQDSDMKKYTNQRTSCPTM